MARKKEAKENTDETPAPAPPRRGPRIARLFLMVAGGLAAPCLALAAFFLSGQSEDPPKAAQGGRVTATTRPPASAAVPAGGAATTTTTTAPITSAAGLRDPFAPLVK